MPPVRPRAWAEREERAPRAAISSRSFNSRAVETRLAPAGAVTRQAAEAERELMRRLRRRTATMRSAAPRRPRVVDRLPR